MEAARPDQVDPWLGGPPAGDRAGRLHVRRAAPLPRGDRPEDRRHQDARAPTRRRSPSQTSRAGPVPSRAASTPSPATTPAARWRSSRRTRLESALSDLACLSNGILDFPLPANAVAEQVDLHAQALGGAGPARLRRRAGGQGAPGPRRPARAEGNRLLLPLHRRPARAALARPDDRPGGRRLRRRRPRGARGGGPEQGPGDGDVHVGDDRAPQGDHLHPREHRLEAALQGVRAAPGRRGGRLPRLPAALPHVRPLAGADRLDLVGRDLRLRPLHRAGVARRGLQGGPAQRLHLRPQEVDGAARRGSSGVGGGGAGGGRGPPAGDHRRAARATASPPPATSTRSSSRPSTGPASSSAPATG